MTNPATTRPAAIVSQRILLRTGAAMAALHLAAVCAAGQDEARPNDLIGYTEFCTDLPGGRHANIKTRRAVVVKADGSGQRVLAEDLTRAGLLDATCRLVAGRQGGPCALRLEER